MISILRSLCFGASLHFLRLVSLECLSSEIPCFDSNAEGELLFLCLDNWLMLVSRSRYPISHCTTQSMTSSTDDDIPPTSATRTMRLTSKNYLMLSEFWYGAEAAIPFHQRRRMQTTKRIMITIKLQKHGFERPFTHTLDNHSLCNGTK